MNGLGLRFAGPGCTISGVADETRPLSQRRDEIRRDFRSASSNGNDPLERFLGRHHRLASGFFALSFACMAADSAQYLSRDSLTVPSGFAAAAAVGVAVPLLVAAAGGLAWWRRPSMAGYIGVGVALWGLWLSAGLLSGAGIFPERTTTSAMRAGALATVTAVSAIFTLVLAWGVIKPPYRTLSPSLRRLSRKI